MKKNNRNFGFRIAVGTAVVALTTAFAVSVTAAGFEKTQTYTEGMFTDVGGNEWYAPEVKSVYELGLMNGQGDGIFAPEGKVTVGEAITMAARAAEAVTGEAIAPFEGGAWYQMYIEYAKSKGFVKDGQFENFNRPAKRYEVAQLFENAMPENYYEAKNNVDSIPDVSADMPYYNDLLTLYKAGIVMGSDEYGTFRPDDNIIRAEAAAILNRVALPENRLTKTLVKPEVEDENVVAENKSNDAYLLAHNDIYTSSVSGISSGWVLDNRGGVPRVAQSGGYGVMTDISTTEGTAMIRNFNKIITGVVDVTTSAVVSGTFNGFSLEFRNERGDIVYQIKTINDEWAILGADGSYTTIMENAKNIDDFVFNISVDIDNNTSKTYINKIDCGTYPLVTTGEDTNILDFRFATYKEGTPSVKLSGPFRATVNYALDETFEWHKSEEGLPFGWEGFSATNPKGELVIAQDGYATRTFDPVTGTVIANAEFILSDRQEFSVMLRNNTASIVSFTTDSTNFYVNDVAVYENYVENLWYRLRIEAKLPENKAVIWINGREVAEVDIAANTPHINNIRFANLSYEEVCVDDISIYEKVYHEDYVPAPVRPAGEEKYTVGINVCSLWQNGQHWGWAGITPYEEVEPVLRYYDEGNPETADWEIKYMVEHGIDFQAFCWFADSSNKPLKDPTYGEHLHDGYMYSEYSDEMKYCLIWEANNGSRPAGMDAWKNYYIPYWIENYFKDERYLVVDNKPVVAVLGLGPLIQSLGSGEAVRSAFDYIDDEVAKLGFEGVLFLSGENTDLANFLGLDGYFSYGWGAKVTTLETHKEKNLALASVDKALHAVPTIGVGFNSIPWHGKRYPLITQENYEKVSRWVRDEYLPENSLEDTWEENFVWLSSWNEYGEGHYIMPSNGDGFKYLDVIRKVFTDEDVDESLNTVPTQAQLERINRLYPQNKHLLRKTGYIPAEEVTPETIKINGQDVILQLPTETGPNGEYLVSFDPSKAMDYRLNAFYSWDFDNKKLTLEIGEHKIVYTAGSAEYVFDGEIKDLGFELYLTDGLPMIPIQKLCEEVEYEFFRDDYGTVNINTPQKAYFDELANRKPWQWNFDSPGDTEGWSSSHMDLTVEDGYLRLEPTGVTNDVIMTNGRDTLIPAEKYTKCEIKFRYSYESTYYHLPRFYFTTETGKTMSEAQTIYFPIDSYDTEGEWEIKTIDLTENKAWKGNITYLRFDPFDTSNGWMEIDYIRFISEEENSES